MNKSLRVLAVGTLYPPYAIGGYEILWRDGVHALRNSGHRVRVLCSSWTASHNGEPEDPAVHRRLELYIDDLLDVRDDDRETTLERERRNSKILEVVLREFDPDAVFLGPVGGLPLSVLTILHERGIPQLAFVADEWPRYAPKADPGQRLLGWAGRLRRGAEPPVARRFRFGDVERWVCISQRSAGVLRRVGADPQTISVLSPGPDTRRFKRQDPHPWRGEILYSGRLHPDKGVEHPLRALADLPECRLTIAGTGDPRYGEKLARIAEELAVADRVEMVGEQHDRLPELYAEADVVVFPSVWEEPWGLVPLEAMAVGRPVVATAVGGAAEYLRDGENALVVSPGDPDAIAASIQRLAADRELRSALVEGGLATADEYRYDRFLDRLAGTVASLGEESSEKDRDTSVSESHEHEPTDQPAEEDAATTAAQREPATIAEAPAPAQAPPAAAQEAPAPDQEAPARVQEARSPVQEAPAPVQEALRPAQEPRAAAPAEEPSAAAPEPRVAAADEPAASGEAQEAEEEAAEETPPQKEWLPEGYELVEKEPPTTRAETTEWAAISRAAPAERGRAVSEEASEATPPDAPMPAAADAGGGLSLIARLAALEARVAEATNSSALAALEARVAELSSSTVAGVERNASELATLEGRVSELATSAIAGVERNTAELTAIEKRVSELANSAVARADRNTSELAAFEQRITEMGQSALAGVERTAAKLGTIESRIDELAGTAATTREHQGRELGSLQTRVGELAAFAELRGEGLGQRIDEIEGTLKELESSRSRTADELTTRLESIEQRLATLDGRLEGVESAIEPVADLSSRLERVEGLAAQVWQREQAAIEQQRAASQGLEKLSGMAKLNESSFEQLRGLGLSGTQAARLLAAREARSGFDSVDQLASIPGFPPALITELQQLVES